MGCGGWGEGWVGICGFRARWDWVREWSGVGLEGVGVELEWGGEGIEYSGVSIKTVVGLEYKVWRGYSPGRVGCGMAELE